MVAALSISTHAPLAGRDEKGWNTWGGYHDISTHAPLAGRDMPTIPLCERICISTHAPLAGRDGQTMTCLRS